MMYSVMEMVSDQVIHMFTLLNCADIVYCPIYPFNPALPCQASMAN